MPRTLTPPPPPKFEAFAAQNSSIRAPPLARGARRGPEPRPAPRSPRPHPRPPLRLPPARAPLAARLPPPRPPPAALGVPAREPGTPRRSPTAATAASAIPRRRWERHVGGAGGVVFQPPPKNPKVSHRGGSRRGAGRRRPGGERNLPKIFPGGGRPRVVSLSEAAPPRPGTLREERDRCWPSSHAAPPAPLRPILRILSGRVS